MARSHHIPRILAVGLLLGWDASAPAAAPPPGCNAPQHRQFDFWVGRWTVTDTKSGKPAGTSLIESLYGGCALRENWRSVDGITGGSLSMYDRSDRKWHQTWVDIGGGRAEYRGDATHDGMRFVATMHEEQAPYLMRMTFTRLQRGQVRQLFETSRDDGATWAPSWDLTYTSASG